VLSATKRYEDEVRLLHADEQELRALQGRLDEGVRLSRDEETRFVALQSAISHSRERLPSLEAARRQEKATVDITGLVKSWEPLRQQKQAAYDDLAVKIHEVWATVTSI
jgi:hypothetical protein